MTQKNNILDKPRLDNLANEIWKSAERLRGKFKQYEYQKVVLPMIVLRRLECVLVAWREKKREITQPLIRYQELPQPGYEILPNKYFYEYKPPVETKVLLKEFRALEAEANRLLEGLEG